jgi:hypothetical protein
VNVLLVGNGPSALSKRLGEQIDGFPGRVARFNAYKTKGYEEYVGTRTNIWITCEQYQSNPEEFEWIYWVTWLLDNQIDKRFEDLKSKVPHAQRFPYSSVLLTKQIMEYNVPSSGAIAATHFLRNGHDVAIYGFDFMQPNRPHHYADGGAKGKYHRPDMEWMFFQKHIEKGEIKQFGFDASVEGIPIVRQPSACGSDDDISGGRTPSQLGWYDWIGEREAGKKILDVGAGMCKGMEAMEQYGCDVSGFEIDERLNGLHDKLTIGQSLDIFEDNSFDVVTCVDVVEHVVGDVPLIENMKRIANERIYVSTPNFSRSHAQNVAHCREYTIGQFMNRFSPNEIWVGSPDGWLNRTLLIDGSRHVALDEQFVFEYDGQEWAHFCAVFEQDVNGSDHSPR